MKLQIPNTDIILHDTVLANIKSKYSEPFRKYHNWNHIETIFEFASVNSIALNYRQQLAILFHDIDYIVGDNNNELQSAMTFENEYVEYIPNLFQYDINEIRKMILYTAEHDKYFPEIPKEYQLVLDLDLHAFGTNNFMETNLMILDEFRLIFDPLKILEGQHYFMSKLLEREKIFYILTTLEYDARKNIEQYLKFIEHFI